MQANQKNNTLYFQFQVTGDHDFDQWDGIVLGFDNTNAADPHRYTFIYISTFGVLGSNVGATSGIALPANQVLYWQSQDGTTWTEGNPGPSWITASASSAGNVSSASNLAWNVLVSINNAGQSGGGPTLPTGAGSAFGFYMNAVRVWSSYTGSGDPDTQFTWPPDVDLVNDLNPSAGVPTTSSWGNATMDTSQTCSGVYFTSSDISNSIAGGPATTAISWTQSNTINVNVHNSGVGKAANKVVASFKIADFGLPSSQDWQTVGLYPPAPGTGKDDSVPNVNSSPVTIPGAVTSGSPPGYIPGTQSIKAGPWNLGPSNAAWYQDNSDPNNPHQHQCILVELDSTSGDTTFVNRSTWNNFEFTATASQFKSPPATVSANYPAIGGQANQTFEIAVAQHEVTPGNNYPLPQGSFKLAATTTGGGNGNGGDVHYLDYTVSSCRLTGKSLKIEGPPTVNSDHRITAPGQAKTFVNCDDGGAYGYLIKHQGTAKWASDLAASGAGVQMKNLAANQYELVIPQGKKAQLISTVSSSGSITGGTGFKLCGASGSKGAFMLMGGMFAVGLALYRPRRKKGQQP